MTGKMWTDNFEPSADVSDDGDYIKRVYLNSFTCDPSDENGNSLVAFSRVIQLLFFVALNVMQWISQCSVLNCVISLCSQSCAWNEYYVSSFSAPYFLLHHPYWQGTLPDTVQTSTKMTTARTLVPAVSCVNQRVLELLATDLLSFILNGAGKLQIYWTIGPFFVVRIWQYQTVQFLTSIL